MNKSRKALRWLLAAGALVLALAAAPAFGATYTLRAAATTLTLPDGTEVPMWGFALVSYDLGAGEVAGDNVVTIPGPRLVVPAGQGLTVNLINELPAAVSIVIPGQALPLAAGAAAPAVARNADGRIRSFVHETAAAVGGVAGPAVPYEWAAIKAGTYLYHSGTHPAVQVQMGLYGAATSNAVEADAVLGTPAEAYPGAVYDSELLLVYSEIDPALHDAVAGPAPTYGTAAWTSTLDYEPSYFLVNGQPADEAAPAATVSVNSRLLVRMVNAGLFDHSPQLLGSYLSVIAEDGNPYPYPREHTALLLAAGKTRDALFSEATAGTYSLSDRRFYRSNLAAVSGAMVRYISVVP